jgi:putative ABC transport system permease protein
LGVEVKYSDPMVAAVEIEALIADMRYALRQLRQSPGFAAAVVLTLALAIGANTAIFSVVNAMLLRPIPYADSSRLLCIWRGQPHGYSWYTFSYPRFRFFQEQARDIAELGAYDDESVTLSGAREPVLVEGGRVSANFFSLLGVKPAIGRAFLPGEDAHGATPVVLLSNRLWRQRYSADPKILGKSLSIDNGVYTIIGVLPAGFQFQDALVDVWRSRIVDTRTFAPESVQLGASYLTVVARMRPGIKLAEARAKFAVLDAQYRQVNPGNSDVVGTVWADSLQTKLFASLHLVVLVLWGAVICLLAIACANIANLVLARATARYRDASIRIALGASWRRVAQQLMTESIILALLSALASLPVALAGIKALVPAMQQASRTMPHVQLDARVLLFTFATAGAVGLAFGLTPLLVLSGANLRGGLHSEGRSVSGSFWSTQLRSGIVSAQFAFCLVLLAAAGLLRESFVRMSTLQTGLRTQHVMATQLDLMPDRYQTPQSRVNFYSEVLRRVSGIPGIRGAAITSRVDLVGSGLGYVVQVEVAPDLGPKNPVAEGRSITPEYFNVLGIPLLRGRAFSDRDTAVAHHVTIINEAFARRFFPGQDPVGKHVTYSTDRITCEIVGVARDVRAALDAEGAEAQIYLPLSQRPWLVGKLLVRTYDVPTINKAIHQQIQAVDTNQAVSESVPFDEIVANRLGQPRTVMSVVGVFAASALLLAAVGMYGIVAYSVAQRKKEIGIRIALGADAGRVRALVLRQTFKLLLTGLLAGLPLAAVVNPLFRGLLFGVTPADPATFFISTAALFTVAIAASAIPALRASSVNPITVLRAE